MPISKLSFSIIFFEKSTGRRNYDLIHKVKEKIIMMCSLDDNIGSPNSGRTRGITLASSRNTDGSD